VREDERRARIMAAVTEPDTAEPGELARRLCRYAVDEMALSGCALVLMSGAESALKHAPHCLLAAFQPTISSRAALHRRHQRTARQTPKAA